MTSGESPAVSLTASVRSINRPSQSTSSIRFEKTIFERFMPRVVVVGSSNTDMTVRVPRLPAPGQTMLGSTFTTTPGGKGANQAVAARRAGAEVVFVTAVGNDDLGKQALELYQREGIDVSHVRYRRWSAVGRGVDLRRRRWREHDRRRVRVPITSSRPDDVDRLPDSLFRARTMCCWPAWRSPWRRRSAALRRGFEAGMRTILNPAPAPATRRVRACRSCSRAADVITPNRVEALALAGMTRTRGVEPDWSQLRPPAARDGAAVRGHHPGIAGLHGRSTGEHLVNSGAAGRGVDTVGAGDAFNGALAVALAEGRSLVEAAAWANAAAALAVTRPGAQSALPYRDAIDRLAAQAVAMR